MRCLFLFLFSIPLQLFANDDYIFLLQKKIEKASSFSQKLEAYENWLPVAISIHDSSVEKSLNDLHKLAQNEKSDLAEGIYNLNNAYFYTENFGDYSKGLELCLKAKDVFEKLHAKPQLVMAYNRLAFIVLWNQIGKKDIANKENLYEKYLSRALQYSEELNDNNLKINTLGFIGSYYIVTEKDNQKALNYFKKAEALFSNETKPDVKLVILESIGIVLSELNNEKNLISYLQKAEDAPYFETFGYGRSNLYRSIAKFYFTNPSFRNIDKALYYAERAYNISLQMHAPEYISQGAQLLYEINKKTGNIENALLYHEKYKNTEDSVSRERFQKTYTAYDVVKKEATIKTLENEKLKQKNDKDNLIGTFLIVALLAGLSFLLFIFWSNKKLKIQNEQLFNKNKEIKAALITGQNIERKRVAAELHDNLGVQTNAILYSTELLKKEHGYNEELLDQLNDTAKEMLLNLRDTLWVMKTEEIAAVDLWLRFINFSSQMGRNYPSIIFSTKGNAPPVLNISTSMALNCMMILREAIQNSIKHADATEIITTSFVENNIWSVSISDNGKGFDENEKNENGECFGLVNMKERASAVAILLKIKSIKDSGTKVTLNITA